MVINELLFNNYGDPFIFTPSVPYVAILAASYLGGVYIYVIRCPERYKPGKYNVCGHSHQIWHGLVVMGIFWTYLAAISTFEMRRVSVCPAWMNDPIFNQYLIYTIIRVNLASNRQYRSPNASSRTRSCAVNFPLSAQLCGALPQRLPEELLNWLSRLHLIVFVVIREESDWAWDLPYLEAWLPEELRPERPHGQLKCSTLTICYLFVVHDRMCHLFLGQTSQHSLLVLGFSIYQNIFDIGEPFVLDKTVYFRMVLLIFLEKKQNVENMAIIPFFWVFVGVSSFCLFVFCLFFKPIQQMILVN